MHTWQRARTCAGWRCNSKAPTEAPHFDRAAFKAHRIYVTLAPDGKTANFNFTPDEQELKCMLAPEAFTPIPNAWGRQGWTTATLSKLSTAELNGALEMAYAHGVGKEETARPTLHHHRGIPCTISSHLCQFLARAKMPMPGTKAGHRIHLFG